MNILIIENDISAAAALRGILTDMVRPLRVVGVAESAEECSEWLAANPAPDIIFANPRLPDGPVIPILERAHTSSPVVFVAANPECVLEAFRVDALDFIIAPATHASVGRAIEKLRTRACDLSTTAGQHGKWYAHPRRLLIGYRDRLIPLDAAAIVFAYTSDKKTEIALSDGVLYHNRRSLDDTMRMLDPTLFYRANKQFIVAKEHIASIVVWPDNRLLVEMTLLTPERVFISKNRSADFRRWITDGDHSAEL